MKVVGTLAVILVLWQFPETVATTGSNAQSLTDAITFGLTGDPEPYLLRLHPRSGPVRSRAQVAVYTPFIRVALFAEAQRKQGVTVSSEMVPKELLDSAVFVVFRWACERQECQGPGGMYTRDFPAKAVAVPEYAMPWSIQGTEPKWFTRDLKWLDTLGGLPFADSVAAAAFAPDVIRPGMDLVMYWQGNDRGTLWSRGNIVASEFATWR